MFPMISPLQWLSAILVRRIISAFGTDNKGFKYPELQNTIPTIIFKVITKRATSGNCKKYNLSMKQSMKHK